MSRLRLPLEPRLLSAELAAAYCGVSIPTFEGRCPVIPVKMGSRVLYDRNKVDQWLDSLTAQGPTLDPEDWARRVRDAHAG